MKSSTPSSIVRILIVLLYLPFGEGCGGHAFAQQTTWQNFIKSTMGLDGDLMVLDNVIDMKQTPDGGYILLAMQRRDSMYVDSSNGYLEFYIDTKKAYINLIKLDKFGNLQWNKACNISTGKPIAPAPNTAIISKYVVPVEVLPATDGGYIICSQKEVTKTDGTGNVLWSKSYGYETVWGGDIPGQYCYFYSIQQTTDGGYIVAGTTANFGSKGEEWYLGIEGRDIYLVKLNSAGTVTWAKTYGRIRLREEASCVRQTKDGGYIIAGYNEEETPRNQGEESAFLLKTDSLGVKQWCKYYGIRNLLYISNATELGLISGRFNSVAETPDGGYIATGVATNGFDDYGGLVVKTDDKGNIQWNKMYTSNGRSSQIGKSILPTSDGGYILEQSHAIQDLAILDRQVFYTNGSLLKLDTIGNVQWKRTYNHGEYGYSDVYDLSVFEDYLGATSVIVTQDGGYALLGYTADTIVNNYPNKRIFCSVIKTDSLGKNGDCQNTEISDYTIPIVETGNFIVSTMTTSYEFNNLYSPLTYSVTATGICLKTPITAYFDGDQACVGDSARFWNYSNAGLYAWDFGDPGSGAFNTSTLTTPKHLYSTMGTYTVTLIAKDGDTTVYRADTTSRVVTVLPNKFITVSSDVTICFGDSTLMSANASISNIYFSWLPTDSVTNPSGAYTYTHPSKTTQYTLTAYNGACYDSASLLITVVPSPIPTVQGNTTICQGENTLLSATGVANYLWSTGETTASITLNLTVNTSFSVTSVNGDCYGTKSVNVVVLPGYTVDAGTNVSILKGTSVVLNASTNGTANWYPADGLNCTNCSSPTASPATTTTYYASVENTSNTCIGIDSITVYVFDCSADFFVPNAFSPNADNYNDVFYVYGSSVCIQSFSLKIYDRWGNNVFTSANVEEGWDGTLKGKPMDPAVFVYYVNAVLFSGETINKKGNISLVK